MRSLLCIAMIVAVAVASCGDFSPLQKIPLPLDAGGDTSTGSTIPQACLSCLTAPLDGGASCVTACNADTKCAQAYACMTYTDCIYNRNKDQVITCAIPCGQNASIPSETDPSAQLLLDVLNCGIAHCGTACALSP